MTLMQVQAASPVTVNPERLGGQAVVAASRVPLTALLDHIDIRAFCDDFDTITPEQAQAAIDYLKELAEDGALGDRVAY
jgi:uncharacterized protein (DUF433 family)